LSMGQNMGIETSTTNPGLSSSYVPRPTTLHATTCFLTE
jgi:hypothetical protein